MVKTKKIIGSKKGFVQALASILPIMNPWVLLGIAIFLIIAAVMIFFALGQIIGTAIVVLGIMIVWRLDWRVGLGFILLGVLLFTNPFGWDGLSMVPLQAWR